MFLQNCHLFWGWLFLVTKRGWTFREEWSMKVVIKVTAISVPNHNAWENQKQRTLKSVTISTAQNSSLILHIKIKGGTWVKWKTSLNTYYSTQSSLRKTRTKDITPGSGWQGFLEKFSKWIWYKIVSISTTQI